MKTLLIVVHSMTGGSQHMAAAAAQAAQSECTVQLKNASDAQAKDVLKADGILIVTPENLGSMSGMMKDFFDRVYYDLLDLSNGKPYATMICAGSDGTGAVHQIERIATGLRWRAIAPALIINTQAQTRAEILAPKKLSDQQQQQCTELGATFAAGLSSGIF